MEKLVLIIHSLAAIAIIGLILLQQGKGAAAGASFGGGASQTVFGSEGSGNFFTRATAIIATIFFCTSFGLAVIAKNQSKVATQGLVVPAAVQQQVRQAHCQQSQLFCLLDDLAPVARQTPYQRHCR